MSNKQTPVSTKLFFRFKVDKRGNVDIVPKEPLIMQPLASLPTNSRVKVGQKSLRIQQRLGNGAFGVVYKVQDVSSSRIYALKDVLCLNPAAIRYALSEVETMKQISHENVITMIGADQHRNSQGLHMLILT